jgi:hypothetical protein
LKRKKLLPKPSPPPEGMMYDQWGRLIPIESMENACQAIMIGFGKGQRYHWSRDQDYFLVDKTKEARKNG